jgi:hypothetical protein
VDVCRHGVQSLRYNSNLIIGGDFNVNNKRKTPEGYRLQEFQDTFALSQLINQPPWQRIITDNNGTKHLRKSMLDHVYTNYELAIATVEDKWSSDHAIIKVTFPNTKQVQREKKTIR